MRESRQYEQGAHALACLPHRGEWESRRDALLQGLSKEEQKLARARLG